MDWGLNRGIVQGWLVRVMDGTIPSYRPGNMVMDIPVNRSFLQVGFLNVQAVQECLFVTGLRLETAL